MNTHIPAELPLSPSVALYAARPWLPAPRGHLFASVCWLVGRHPVLARLAARVPEVVDEVGDVLPWELTAAVRDLDEHRAAWKQYEDTHPAPRGYDDAAEVRYDAWVNAGPAPSPRVEALSVMSRTELVRLRLLATFDDVPGPLCVSELDGFDAEGRDLVRDWMVAVLAYSGDPTAPAVAAALWSEGGR